MHIGAYQPKRGFNYLEPEFRVQNVKLECLRSGNAFLNLSE